MGDMPVHEPHGSVLNGVLTADTLEKATWPQLVDVLLQPGSLKKTNAVVHEIQQRIAADVAQNRRDVLLKDRDRLAAVEYALGHGPHWSLVKQSLLEPVFQDMMKKVGAAIGGGKLVAQPSGFGAANSQPPVADPVDPSTGHLLYVHADLHLDGGGMTFEFVRTHRSSGKTPLGPLGAAWDHSHHVYVRELSPDAVVVGTGGFREDRYTLTQPADSTAAPYFAPPDGTHATLEPGDAVSGDSYVLTVPDGTRYHFEAESTPGLHRVTRIVDRFGNQLVFEYDDGGRLSRVIVNDPARRDPPQASIDTRFVRFDYDDLNRIVALRDSTGRTVRYDYDDDDDLTRVTLPKTPDYPFGRVVSYQYTKATGPLPHQLVSVIDEDGRRYLDVEYGADDSFVDLARVVALRDDDGEWLFEYGDLEHADTDRDTPVRYTAMVRPTGQRIEMQFNNAGNLLQRVETALDEEGALTEAISLLRYNADGAVVAQIAPGRTTRVEDGYVLQQRFGREEYLLDQGRGPFDDLTDDIAPTTEQRRGFGNRTVHMRRRVPVWPPLLDAGTPQPGDIVQRFAYDNPFQQLTSESDPRDPTRLTVYEYEPVGEATGVPGGALTRVKHPPTTAPDGTQHPGGVETFGYDPLGRQTLLVDAEGHRTVRTYFGPHDLRPRDFTTAMDLPPSVTIDGQLASVTTADGEKDAATTTFDVNARGARVLVTDPRGGVTRLVVDPRDLPVQVERVLRRPDGSELAYATRTRYTAEGKPRRVERDILDDTGAPLAGGLEVRMRRYGDTGLLLRESVGGADPRLWLATRHVYDAEGRRTRTITPGGTVTHFRYDAQRRLTAVTRGFGTDAASTTRTRYDLGGRKRAEIDPRGNLIRYDYDAFGRVAAIVSVIDVADPADDVRPLAKREGHTRVFTRDALDNVTLERFFEWTAPGKYRLLARTSTTYDERGRPVCVVRDLFPDPVDAAALDDFALAPPAGAAAIEAWLFYDRNGRVVEQREGVVTSGPHLSKGSLARIRYDAAGRQIEAQVVVPEQGSQGTVVCVDRSDFDGNGNPLRVTHVDHRPAAAGLPAKTELIAAAAVYDSLNRKTTDVDGLGNQTTYRYDSRDLLVERRDALGRSITYDYDVYRRRRARTEKPDTTRTIAVQYTYDLDGRLTLLRRDDPAQAPEWVTEYAYDALDRRTATVLAPGAGALERHYAARYDRAGNLVEQRHPSGLREVATYDALNRRTRTDYNASGVALGGATFEVWRYDGLGRVVQATTDATDVTVCYDSLGRSHRETQTAGGGSLTLARTFDTLGHTATLAYPSGRTVATRYDSAGRLARIDDIVPSPVGAPGAAKTLFERDWIGLSPSRDRYGNGTHTSHGRDRAGRRVLTDHGHPGASLLRFVQLFDAVGNRRHDWEHGTHADPQRDSIVYAYDGVHWLTRIGRSTKPTPSLTGVFMAPPEPPAGAAAPALTGQSTIDTHLGTADVGASAAYDYDADGNRTTLTDATGTTATPADGLDRATSGSYDANGNTASHDGAAFTFDGKDRLVRAMGPSVDFEASYDALGRRLVFREGVRTHRLVYDGVADIAEYEAGALTREAIVPGGVDARLVVSAGQHHYYVHRDYVGSLRMLTDEAGAVAARSDFDPYGTETTLLDNVHERHRFMGRELDATLGLYHFRARHYEPSGARFLQRDPADSAPERSAYQPFGGNPLGYIDPLGTRASHAGETTEAKLERLAGACIDFTRSPTSKTLQLFPERARTQALLAWPRRQMTDAEMEAFLRMRERQRNIALAQLGAAMIGGLDEIRFAGPAQTLNMLVGNVMGKDPQETLAENRLLSAWDALTLLGAGGKGTYVPQPVSKPSGGPAPRMEDPPRFDDMPSHFEELPFGGPRVTLDYKRAPHLVEGIYHASRAGHPEVLTYFPTQDEHRGQSMPEVRRQKRPGYSWDEYPFASTIEGGWGAFMSRVPKEEQQYQAGVLGPFMKNLRPGERFQVNLINIPESLTTLP